MVDLTDKVFNPELALEIYQSVKARASKENIHLVDFAAALITVLRSFSGKNLEKKKPRFSLT